MTDASPKFNFTTEYLPGDLNVLADALSRYFDVLVTAVTVKGAKVEVTSVNMESALC